MNGYLSHGNRKSSFPIKSLSIHELYLSIYLPELFYRHSGVKTLFSLKRGLKRLRMEVDGEGLHQSNDVFLIATILGFEVARLKICNIFPNSRLNVQIMPLEDHVKVYTTTDDKAFEHKIEFKFKHEGYKFTALKFSERARKLIQYDYTLI